MITDYQIGDEVIISLESPYYNENTLENPTDTLGIITGIESDIIVMWDNGVKNSYSSNDLSFTNESIYDDFDFEFDDDDDDYDDFIPSFKKIEDDGGYTEKI